MNMLKANGYEERMLASLGHHKYTHVFVEDDEREVANFMIRSEKAPYLTGLLLCAGWEVRVEVSNIWPKGTPSWGPEVAEKLINREKELAG